jgi:hypothetical protein
VAADVRQLADASDVVCICVVDDKQLHAVAHDARDGPNSSDTLIIQSSVIPATAREIDAPFGSGVCRSNPFVRDVVYDIAAVARITVYANWSARHSWVGPYRSSESIG